MRLPQDKINTTSRFSLMMKGRCQTSSVSFSPKSEMCLVDKHNNTSDLFYSVQELHMIKQRKIISSYHLPSCNIIGQDFVMLENVADMSAKKRRASVEAVLSKHHRQLSLGVYDPNTLANVSGAESAWAQEHSRTIALIHSD
jgi:hypothetical protein